MGERREQGGGRAGRVGRGVVLFCALATAWLFSPAARAQALPPLTLEEVLESVERLFPSVEVARLDLEAARTELLAAEGGFDPELKGRATQIPFGPYPYSRLEIAAAQPTPFWGAQLFGGWRWGEGEIPLYYGNLETNRYGELRAGVSLPLWRNRAVDRRRTSLERARVGARAAKLGISQTELEAARTAAHRYWEWVGAGRKVEVAREVLVLAQSRDAQILQRMKRGDVPAIERVENQRALLQRQAQLVSAERSFQQAALELSLYLRDAEGTPVVPGPERLPPALPEPGPVAILLENIDLEDVYRRRPDVQRLLAQRGQQDLERAFAENQTAPQIDVSVAAAKDIGPGSAKLGKPELELGLTLDVPLLNRAAGGRERGARASLSKLDVQLRLLRDRVAIEIRDSMLATRATSERAALAKAELAAARELEQGERVRFSHGDSTLLFVNLREQAAAEAAQRYVDALMDHQKALASLRAALALPQLSALSSRSKTDGE